MTWCLSYNPIKNCSIWVRHSARYLYPVCASSEETKSLAENIHERTFSLQEIRPRLEIWTFSTYFQKITHRNPIKIPEKMILNLITKMTRHKLQKVNNYSLKFSSKSCSFHMWSNPRNVFCNTLIVPLFINCSQLDKILCNIWEVFVVNADYYS